ncbi:DNA polymerase-3 subunit gamma/tau [Nocardia amikacinitolerans]|uniref:DNA polymerase III subunit gamma/tau n=1 Tax=Nocardia amikacinitolerans TaxID=756689 RepID=A0A285LRG1_9NOCA|nr:DNA polymerase III subunit gamma and tau [Nocardia amikacinitolerans]SNY87043.1 DNA polymerase-3 subunit gamma/tau [Nocardia amikacinitolerans]
MALYRKYRPATFAEVVGQEHVTDPLSTALDTGRISHAYLFSGPRGCGKTSSARILARSLNCVQGPTSRPCGVCPSCVALGPGGPGNLDVIELDAASHGGVDDTRELRDRAFYAPAESRYRVFIVDEAHMVTTAGFNALLKIVEEPPAHLIFIFATTEPDKVLPTIRSRTHHYPFRLLPPATMRGLLGKICEQEDVPVEEAVYPLVIRAGGGSPRDSLSVLDQLLAGAGPEGVTYNRAVALLGVTDVALIDDAVEALAAGDGAALFGTVDSVMEAGHDPRRFAVDLLERFRDLILLRAVPDAADRGLVSGPGDVLDRMREQAQRIGPGTLTRYAELLHEGLGEMRGATAPRLLLEVVCARMLLPSVSDTESATLQRLERLERGFAGGAVAPLPPTASAADAPPSAAPAPARSPGEPSRRRGAEALAALRESKTRGANSGPDESGTGASGGAVGQGSPAPDADAREDVSVHRPERADAAVVGAPIAQQDAVRANAGDTGVEAGQSPPRAADEGYAKAPTGQPAPGDGPAGGRNMAAVHSAPSAVQADAGIQGNADAPAGRSAASQDGPAEGRGTAAGVPVESAPSRDAAGARLAERSATTPGSAERTGYEAAQEVSDAAAASGQVPGGSAAARGGDDVPGARAAAGAESMAAAAGRVGDDVAGARAAASAESVAAAGRVGDDVAGARAAAGAESVAAALPDEPTGAMGGSAGAMDEPSGAQGDELLRAVEGAWTEIRAKVREFGPTVQALLSGASVARVDGAVIVFAHQHAPLAQRLSDPRNVEAVRSAVRAVLGSDHEIRWEAGGAVPRPAAQQANRGRGAGAGAAGRGSGAQGGRGDGGPPKFSRPSQTRANAAGDAPARQQRPAAPPRSGEDDIPPPDYPDLPDDPGPGDYPPPDPVGYETTSGGAGSGSGGVPGPSTPEEEQEMLAEAAKPVAPEARHDPDEVALELLRSELGATRLDG